MLELDKKTQDKFAGELNHTVHFSENGSCDVSVDSVFNLSDKGFYIDWRMTQCGFGQYSVSKSEDGWYIDNECMGLCSSLMIIEALEHGLKAQNDSRINYILKKLIYEMSPYATSLVDGFKMIWNAAKKDEIGTFVVGEKLTPEIQLGNLKVTSLNFANTKGTFKKKFFKQVENIGIEYQSIVFAMNFELKWYQFGTCFIEKETHSGKDKYFISKNLTKETLLELFKILEEINIEKLIPITSDKELINITKIKSSWENFKLATNLPSNIEEMGDVIFENGKAIYVENNNVRVI